MVEDKKLTLADGEHAVNYVTEQKEQTEQKGQKEQTRKEQTEQVGGAEQITETGTDVKKIIKTYRIVKGHPEAGIFEKELFDKYFGTVLGNCQAHSE